MIGAASIIAAETDQEEPTLFQEDLMRVGFRVFKEPIEAPDFTLEDLNGVEISLSSFKGKYVFLNFWATWCGPCRVEMPTMEALYQTYGGDYFEMVAVDIQESQRAVKKYIDAGGFTFKVLLDSSGKVGGTYGARSIPTTYLIDPEGFAVAYLIGSREWKGEEVDDVFAQLIGSVE